MFLCRKQVAVFPIDGPANRQRDRLSPVRLSVFSNGEPCHAQSIAIQFLGNASQRRGCNRDRSSAGDRARRADWRGTGFEIEDPVDKSDNFFARISVFPMGSRSFPVSAVSQPILTEGQTDGQIDCPPEGSQFFNGEPCYAQSTSVQLLGTASNRGRRLRDRGSTAHRVRVRSAADSPILKQVV